MLKTSKRWLAGLASLALATGLGACGDGSRPPGDFATAPAPKRPDYASTDSWAVLPAQPPAGAWEKPWGVDVFFVHPGSAFEGKEWNAAINDATAAKRLDEHVIPNHAGPFIEAAPTYAPRYRQADYWVEANVGGGGDGAFLVAYNDVLDAFDAYVARSNRGRGIILAGVGQGGLYVERLLADRFQSGPLKERLGAAYVIDAAVPEEALGAQVSQKACDGPDAIGCISAWRGVVGKDSPARARDKSAVWTADWKAAPSKGKPLVCVNPVTSIPGGEAKADESRGARKRVLGAETDVVVRGVAARCKDGLLEIDQPADAALRGAGAKTPDYNLFYNDILADVTNRATTLSVWLDAHAPKPAEPLPPASGVDDLPIHREGGEPIPVPSSGN